MHTFNIGETRYGSYKSGIQQRDGRSISGWEGFIDSLRTENEQSINTALGIKSDKGPQYTLKDKKGEVVEI
jgi:hypothetical protein